MTEAPRESDYAMVPVDVLRAVQRNKAAPSDMRIIAALLEAQCGGDGDQEAVLTYEQIGAMVRLSKRQSITVVAKLMNSGALEAERSAGRSANRYRLVGSGADRTMRCHPWQVYFIQAGVDGPIKVGVALDPSERLRTLQTGSDVVLTLLGSIPGGVELESRLHAEFAPWRRRGEWFDPTPALLERIRNLTTSR